MSNGLKAYLGGPMAGLTVEECRRWRVAAAETLREAGFVILDPTKGLGLLKPGEKVRDAHNEEVTQSAHVVFKRDEFDVTRCDIAIFNLLGATRTSIGSVMEIGLAYLCRKFVIVVMEPQGNVHDHAFVKGALSIRLETVDEAVEYAINTFGEG